MILRYIEAGLKKRVARPHSVNSMVKKSIAVSIRVGVRVKVLAIVEVKIRVRIRVRVKQLFHHLRALQTNRRRHKSLFRVPSICSFLVL